jgi:hypothetical protein
MSATIGTVITATEYNESHLLISDILGLGENGWGMPFSASTPASSGNKIYARSWVNLLDDINYANKHIYGTKSTLDYAVTGTTVVSAAYANSLVDLATSLSSEEVRYTCHPSNFVFNPLTNSTTNFSDSVSIRTLPWGANGTTMIEHTMVVSWPNRLSARYYFNEGNYLVYNPFYSGVGLNDLDTEWDRFFTYLGENPWKYTHHQFVNYRTTTTNWTSGTLEIIVSASIATNDKRITVDVQYINNASADLILTPAVSIFNIS